MANVTQRKWGHVRQAPNNAKAVISKLHPDKQQQHNPAGRQANTVNLDRSALEKESQLISQDIVDADAVFQLLPDLELAEQILVGSIISPKDMSTVALSYKAKDSGLQPDVVAELVSVVKDYFNDNYKFEERMSEQLSRILFKRGSDAYIVIPENNLDQLLNQAPQVSTEHYGAGLSAIASDRPFIGYLGHPKRANQASLGLESHTAQKQLGSVEYKEGKTIPFLSISDNLNILKKPLYRTRHRTSKIADVLKAHNTGLEDRAKAGRLKGFTPEQIDELYNPKHRTNQQVPAMAITPSEFQNEPSRGNPYLFNPPAESLIPVHVPGDPTDHVGYFLLLDPLTGRPLQRDRSRDYYGEIRDNFSSSTSSTGSSEGSDLLQMTREAFGDTGGKSSQTVEQLHQAYETIVENDLQQRLRNGIYEEDLTVAFTQEIYTIMLARGMRQQGTHLLYIPAEFVIYMAFDYDDRGVGKSLLKQNSLIANMRSILMFADTMRGVRDAVGRKRANIFIDKDDPDPYKTANELQGLILESGQRGFPLGAPDPSQQLNYLHRAGYDFSLEIEGENYPRTKVDFDDYSSTTSGGNPELQDQLRRINISGLGLNPEQVDPTQSPDFAVSVANNNLVLTRRILGYQGKYTGFLTRLIRVIVANSPVLREKLEKSLKAFRGRLSDAKREESRSDNVQDFLESLYVELPAPDTTKIEHQLTMFEQFSQLLDRTIDSYISTQLFKGDHLGRSDEDIEHLRAILIAGFQREFLANNNILPELQRLLEMDERSPAFNIREMQEHVHRTLGRSARSYFKWISKQTKENLDRVSKEEGGLDDDADDEVDWGRDESTPSEAEATTPDEEDDTLNLENIEDDFNLPTQDPETQDEADTSETEGEDPDESQKPDDKA